MQKDLLTELHGMLAAETSTTRKADIHRIISLLQTDENTAANYDGINAVKQQAQTLIETTKQDIQETQKALQNNYDEFIKALQTSLVSDDEQSAVLGTPLFTANEKVISSLIAQEQPEKTYLDLNKKIMDGFANALNTNSASDLNMTELTYRETKSYVENTQKAISE